MDVQNAFLYSDLLKEVYMQLFLNFPRQRNTFMECRLNKSLNGLKQAYIASFRNFPLLSNKMSFINLKLTIHSLQRSLEKISQPCSSI